jgi:hypothetical protein
MQAPMSAVASARFLPGHGRRGRSHAGKWPPLYISYVTLYAKQTGGRGGGGGKTTAPPVAALAHVRALDRGEHGDVGLQLAGERAQERGPARGCSQVGTRGGLKQHTFCAVCVTRPGTRGSECLNIARGPPLRRRAHHRVRETRGGGWASVLEYRRGPKDAGGQGSTARRPAACLGFGRIVASEREVPNMLANLV